MKYAIYEGNLDRLGILLANNYSVEVIPMDERRKLKIIIKESEV